MNILYFLGTVLAFSSSLVLTAPTVVTTWNPPSGLTLMDYVTTTSNIYFLYNTAVYYDNILSPVGITALKLFDISVLYSGVTGYSIDSNGATIVVGLSNGNVLLWNFNTNSSMGLVNVGSNYISIVRMDSSSGYVFASHFGENTIRKVSIQYLNVTFVYLSGVVGAALKFEIDRSQKLLYASQDISTSASYTSDVFYINYVNDQIYGTISTKGDSSKPIHQIAVDFSDIYVTGDYYGIYGYNSGQPGSFLNAFETTADITFTPTVSSIFYGAAVLSSGPTLVTFGSDNYLSTFGLTVSGGSVSAVKKEGSTLVTSTSFTGVVPNKILQFKFGFLYSQSADNVVTKWNNPQLYMANDPPEIISITPSVLNTPGNDILTISVGPHPSFVATTTISKITIGSSLCVTPTFVFSTTINNISCSTPAGVGEYQQVQIVFNQPATGLSIANILTRINYARPSITSISPADGPTLGGTMLTLNVNNLVPELYPAVSIGPNSCTVSTVGSNSIICRVPVGYFPGPQSISLKANSFYVTSTINFVYDSPVISSVLLTQAGSYFTTGGYQIRILGYNYGSCGAPNPCPQPVVKIGGSTCSNAIILSDSNMTCYVPSGVGKNLNLSVSINSASSNMWSFSYDPPRINSIYPSIIESNGGELVSVYGVNFGQPNLNQLVYFVSVSTGNFKYCTITSTGDSQISCTLPANMDREYHNVYVSVGGQVSTDNITFYNQYPNRPPYIINSTTACQENDAAVLVTISSGDPDLNDFVVGYKITRYPVNGNLFQYVAGSNIKGAVYALGSTFSDSNIVYQPSLNFFGLDSFDIVATDSHQASSNTSTMWLNVAFVNQRPFRSSTTIYATGLEDQSMSVFVDASDIDDSVLSCFITVYPNRGVLLDNLNIIDPLSLPYYLPRNSSNLRSGVVTYQPPLYVYGNNFDQFYYNCEDSLNQTISSDIQVEIVLNHVDHAPFPSNLTVTTDQLGIGESGGLTITLAAIDVDGEFVDFFVQSLPAFGSLYLLGPLDIVLQEILVVPFLIQNGKIKYVPSTNYHGDDTFYYFATDGMLNSSVVSVDVVVNHVNQRPYPLDSDFTVTVLEDSFVDITLTAIDIEQDAMNFSITQLPLKGLLFINDQEITSINSFFIGSSNSSLNVKYKYVTGSGYGQGFDFFQWSACDPQLSCFSPDGVVNIDVQHVNHPPVAIPVIGLMDELGSGQTGGVNIQLESYDADGDSLTYYIESIPSQGNVFELASNGIKLDQIVSSDLPKSLLSSKIRYEPFTFFYGIEVFNFSVQDAVSSSNQAEIQVTVNHLNQAPVPVFDSNNLNWYTNEDQPKLINLTAYDVDQDCYLSFMIVSLPTKGSLIANDGTQVSYVPFEIGYSPNVVTLEYIPGAYYGENYDFFQWTAVDSGNLSFASPLTFTINVKHVNHAPQCNTVSVVTYEDEAVLISLNATDKDIISSNDVLAYRISHLPLNGILTEVDPSTKQSTGVVVTTSSILTENYVFYTPNADYNGNDTFKFVANDGKVDCEAALSVLTIVPVNDPPVFSPVYTPLEIKPDNQPVQVSINVFDVDYDSPYIFSFLSVPRGKWYLSKDLVGDPFDFSDIEVSKEQNYTLNLYLVHDNLTSSLPYANISFMVQDAFNLSASLLGNIYVTVTCPPTQYNNIFSDSPDICVDCPVGGICSSSGAFMPFNQAGYYPVSVGNTTYFLPCFPASACNQGEPDIISSQSLTTAICSKGYYGLRCGVCQDSYYRKGNQCTKCPVGLDTGVLILVVFIGIIGALALINVLRKVDVGFFGVLITFLQTISILKDFQIEWPSNIGSMFHVLSFFNLNIEIVSPECFIVNNSNVYELKYYSMMSLPLIVLAICILLVLFERIFFYIRQFFLSSKNKFDTVRPNTLDGVEVITLLILLKGDLDEYVNLTPSKIPFYGTISSVYLLFLRIIYLVVTRTALALFDCSQKDDGRFYFNAEPSRICYQAWWWKLVPYSIFGIIAYVIGVPALLYYLYYEKKRIDPNEKVNFKEKFILYAMYQKKKFYKEGMEYWDVIMTLRKLVIVVGQLFLTSYVGIQVVFLLIVFDLFVVHHVSTRPYMIENLNKLETACLVTTNFILLCGLLFYINSFSAFINATLLGVFVILTVICCVCGIFVLFLYYIKSPLFTFLFGIELNHEDNNNGKAE